MTEHVSVMGVVAFDPSIIYSISLSSGNECSLNNTGSSFLFSHCAIGDLGEGNRCAWSAIETGNELHCFGMGDRCWWESERLIGGSDPLIETGKDRVRWGPTGTLIVLIIVG